MLRAIILIGLVGQAAAEIKCMLDKDVAPCVKDECWTHTTTAIVPVITYGCGGKSGDGDDDTCNTGTGNCELCTTDREGGCNAVGGDFMCVVDVDGTNGEAAATACAEPTCWTLTSKADKPVITRGCGKGATGSVQCHTERDLGCNLEDGPADWNCWVGDIIVGVVNANGKGEVCTAPTDKCYTRTMKNPTTTVEKGCGPCVPGNEYTCSKDLAVKQCGTNVANGCNEPPRFQCFLEDDATEAADCTNYFIAKSCKKIVKSVDGEDDVITKACGVCPAKGAEVAGEKCYACDKTGCNSASGLFSVLALTLAVIYQLA